MTNINQLLHALSDNTRRTILQKLQKKDCTPGELITMFSITKPSLSHHLNVLKQANLVISERQGQHQNYSLNVSVFEEGLQFIFNLFQKK